MTVLFIGKRFYTNRDALRERYGRIWQLPWHWVHAGFPTQLWLVDYHSKENVHETKDGLEVISTPARNLLLLRHCIREFFNENKKIETVIASGDCYIGLMAYWLARRMHANFIFDVYDKYDEFGGYRRLPGFDPFKFLLKHSNVRLFASKALLHDLSPAAHHDILVPNGVDMERFMPRDKIESRTALDLSQDVQMIGYFGGMEPDRGVADLIEAVRLLRQDGMNLELLLGGKLVAGLDIHQPGVRYLGNVPFERMPVALASCDMLAIPYRRSAFMDAGASNKIAEAIACARPLVATRTPNLMANFPAQAQQLGSLLGNPGDPADLARVIRAQANQQILVDMPDGMSWKDIALDVARKLSLV